MKASNNSNLTPRGDSNENNNERISLTRALKEILEVEAPEGPSVGQIVDAVEDKGFGILFLVLSLPSALPVPAPGYSTPFGIVIVLLALQMLMGRHVLWIPRRLRKTKLKKELADKALKKSTKVIHWMERFIKPRHQWISSTWGLRILAILIIFMGALMILPIPLTNTAPAMVIFLIGLGLTEEDGFVAIGAFGVGCLAATLYAYIIYLFYVYGPEAVHNLKTAIKSFLD